MRLTIAALAVAALVVLVGTTLAPTHVTFGAGSLRCGTVWHPDRTSEIAGLCGRAGAHHLRAALVVGGGLVLVALTPLLVRLLPVTRPRAAYTVWAILFLAATIAGVASLGLVEYSPPGLVFEL